MISATFEFAITFQMTILITIPLLYISDGVECTDREKSGDLCKVSLNTTTENQVYDSDASVGEDLRFVRRERPCLTRSDFTIDYSLDY